LDEHEFPYKREHRIDFKCAIPGTTYGRTDFMLQFNNVVVFLEVDETQHHGYGISCEVGRMGKVLESLRTDGNTLRMVFIRYNPDAYKVDEVTQNTSAEDRQAALVSLLRKLENEPVVDNADFRTFYMYYDSNQDGAGMYKPKVFEGYDYDQQMQKCLAECIV
jgi:hypothetical protein